MQNRLKRNDIDIDDNVDDINQDVSQLADTLEEVLKSWGNAAGEEADNARRKAEQLLKETRAKLHGRSRIHQAAHDVASYTDSWVREKPWYSIGVGAAVGLFVGALLSSRR